MQKWPMENVMQIYPDCWRALRVGLSSFVKSRRSALHTMPHVVSGCGGRSGSGGKREAMKGRAMILGGS